MCHRLGRTWSERTPDKTRCDKRVPNLVVTVYLPPGHGRTEEDVLTGSQRPLVLSRGRYDLILVFQRSRDPRKKKKNFFNIRPKNTPSKIKNCDSDVRRIVVRRSRRSTTGDTFPVLEKYSVVRSGSYKVNKRNGQNGHCRKPRSRRLNS